ncbi:NUDIX domain-containing protein [Geobacter pelophilus]|uniref:NUDIX domain-containing protein n=1 Tax=Geoanaerobacter pelophilus TaxID=60036 RepID=A0AAW4L217_9BACT|nr:NUDIX domain-containing protein [Geoanaerobacter pelophilus]MBT0665119.1 NUDIX domain-containing protein [Geoanaerobacter pelophilus]
MFEPYSHCSWCGAPFPSELPWPRHCSNCSNSSYRNPIPVVVVVVPVPAGIVVIRRNIEPQKGTLTLPGGYLDCGETWQEGARRELREETGIEVAPDKIRLYEVCNGLDDTLVIFGIAAPQPAAAVQPFYSEETAEVAVITGPIELGFTMHTQVVARYFAEQRRALQH